MFFNSASARAHHTVPPAITAGRSASQIGGQMLDCFGHISRAQHEGVERDVHEGGAGTPAERGAHAFRGEAVRLIRGLERDGLLRQAAHDLEVVHLLQRTHAPPGSRSAAADHEHRAVAGLRLGQRGRSVRDARTGGDGGDPDLARHLRPTLRGERGRLLVADVDDPDTVLSRAGEDRPDVSAV
jgi:hypothetical protein